MLKVVEISLTVLSIALGTYEILGRTDVIKGRTPVEAVGDAVAGNSDSGEESRGATISPRPVTSGLPDMTVALERCEFVVDSMFFDLVIRSDRRISPTAPVEIVASSNATSTTADALFFDEMTSPVSLDLALPPGPHEVMFEVDAGDQFEETNETNNTLVRSVQVPSDPFDTANPCP